MTGPGPIAQPPSDVATVVGSAIKQLTLDPQAHGITWTLRIATVIQSSPLYAIFDGDPTSGGLRMESLIGTLAPGARVYVIAVPPSGNFAFGYADLPIDPARGLVVQASEDANSAALTVETVVLTTATAQFHARRAYRFLVDAAIAGTSSHALYQIRRTDISGSVVWSGRAWASSGVFAIPTLEAGWLINASDSIVQTELALTLQPLGGVSVTQFTADGLFRTFTIIDVGSSDDWVGAQI